MDYNYKYSLKESRDGGARVFRFVSIFVVVAAATALIIWKTLPAADKKVPAEKTELTQDQPEKGSAETEKESLPQKTSAELTETESASETDSGAGEASGKTEQDPRKEPEVQTVFEKGKVSPGDPPASEDVPAVPAEKQANAEKKTTEPENLLAQKKYAEAVRSAEKLLQELTFGSESYRKTLSLLTRANWERFLSRDTSGSFMTSHTVTAGEYLGRLTRKYKTTIQAAMLANKLKNTNIMIGQKLVFLPGSWKISISKDKRLLLLFRDGKIFSGYDIGIGRQGKTPTADFVISDRLKHPVYRTSDGKVFKYGEPGNELGECFLKLAPAGTPDRPLLGYGIHGTPDESTVTRSLSNGCVRMRNADVMQLYHIVPAGTPVEIKD